MLDTLAKIYDDGGRLLGVKYALFEGDPQSVTAIELRFESVSAVFRAVADDDTLAVSLGTLKLEPDETLIEAGNSAPWAECLGLGMCWAWRLTNQQGYTDGSRLEFSVPGEESRAIVEFIVEASAINIFVAALVARHNNSFNRTRA
jgi:hypothetical protein